MITNCPDCHKPLHEGQHMYDDGPYHVQYCKACGFRKETPFKG